MTRKQFLKTCGILGVGLPFPQLIYGHAGKKGSNSNRIIIIGAGAAGLTAGYLLKQQGIDFSILEASSEYGGRMKINTSFSDFPIALGAEWISTDTMDFSPFLHGKDSAKKIKTVNYLPTDTYWLKSGDKLVQGTLHMFNDKKFVKSSWFHVFEEHVVPYVKEHINYRTKVKAIDYSDEIIHVECNTTSFKTKKVILTAPVPLLKQIDFSPDLPAQKRDAIDKVEYWNGFKAFFRFKEKFYPTFVDYVIQPETSGQVSFYDAAWGQKSDKNILGLFSAGIPADMYGKLSPNEFGQHVLNELDTLFEGKASQNYIEHISQNWKAAPFAKGAYVSDFTEPKLISKLQKTVADKIYFAGDAYTNGSDWGHVHNSIQSAKACVNDLTKEI